MEEQIGLWLCAIAGFLCLLTGLLEYRSHRKEPYGYPAVSVGFQVRDVTAWNHRIAYLWLFDGAELLIIALLLKLTGSGLLAALLVIAVFTGSFIYYLKKLVPAWMVIPDDDTLWKDVKKK